MGHTRGPASNDAWQDESSDEDDITDRVCTGQTAVMAALSCYCSDLHRLGCIRDATGYRSRACSTHPKSCATLLTLSE